MHFLFKGRNSVEPKNAGVDPLRGALNRIERHSYEELVAHIRQSRAGGYTGKPFFTEEFGNHGHISAQLFFETDDETPDVRAVVAYSGRSLLSHMFPKSASTIIRPGHTATDR